MKYIAMNQFTILDERHEEFEQIWKNRERHLNETTGFLSFHLLRGEALEGKRSYVSHSSWTSRADFQAWTQSENFRKAHQNRTPQGIIQGPPHFSGYDVILDESK